MVGICLGPYGGPRREGVPACGRGSQAPNLSPQFPNLTAKASPLKGYHIPYHIPYTSYEAMCTCGYLAAGCFVKALTQGMGFYRLRSLKFADLPERVAFHGTGVERYDP